MTILEQPELELAVAEIQGLYGPFTFTERLLQKIWLRGEFDAAHAVTEDGRPMRIVHPGRWNLLGGPDFRQARVRLGDKELTGDVELHLHACDWAAHGHAADGAYDRVVLHVVLFLPSGEGQARRADGSPIPTLVLLPLLLHDLEEYAAEDAVETLASRTDWRAAEELSRLPAAEARTVLLAQRPGTLAAEGAFCTTAGGTTGLGRACHHAVLEILGYRFNRAPDAQNRRPRAAGGMGRGRPDVGALFAAEAGVWNLQGVRPANHPRAASRTVCRLVPGPSRTGPIDWRSSLKPSWWARSMTMPVRPRLRAAGLRCRSCARGWRGKSQRRRLEARGSTTSSATDFCRCCRREQNRNLFPTLVQLVCRRPAAAA